MSSSPSTSDKMTTLSTTCPSLTSDHPALDRIEVGSSSYTNRNVPYADSSAAQPYPDSPSSALKQSKVESKKIFLVPTKYEIVMLVLNCFCDSNIGLFSNAPCKAIAFDLNFLLPSLKISLFQGDSKNIYFTFCKAGIAIFKWGQ